MEVLSYKLNVLDIIPMDLHSFDSNAVYLWVLHADKIPPHIGISSEGKYFSLKSNGKDENLSITSVQSIVNRKGIKTLLFELDCNLTVDDLQNQFASYSKTLTGEVTCLNPLKALLGYSEPRMLRDLLAELNADQLIKSITGINIDSDFVGIQNYNVEDIHSRLRKLEND